jgi:DNA modification methylase
MHTERGDICYEPFSGSGSQLVAAQQMGRRCYAIEKSPAFVAVALERMATLGLKPELIGE